MQMIMFTNASFPKFICSQFETVLPINLFESLEAAGVAAGALMEYGPNFSLVDYYRSWTEQRGHPVLEVQVNHQTGDMTIHQVNIKKR